VYRATQKVTLHDKIVELVASANSDKFEVRSNPGGEKNWVIRDGGAEYYPDVVLIPKGSSQSTVIVEVETDESVNEDHALEQWVPYSKLGRKFYLLIPSSSLDEAKAICRRHRIAAHFGQYWWDGTRWAINFED
jgi:hypothetical protein